MADAETFLQFLTGVMHKRIIGARLGADEMRRQRRLITDRLEMIDDGEGCPGFHA